MRYKMVDKEGVVQSG